MGQSSVVPRAWMAARVELPGDLVDVVADLGDLLAQGGQLVDVVIERGALAGQGKVAMDVRHDDSADVVGAGDVQ